MAGLVCLRVGFLVFSPVAYKLNALSVAAIKAAINNATGPRPHSPLGADDCRYLGFYLSRRQLAVIYQTTDAFWGESGWSYCTALLSTAYLPLFCCI